MELSSHEHHAQCKAQLILRCFGVLDPQSLSFSLAGYNWQAQSALDPPSFMTTLSQQMNLKQSNEVEIMSQSESSSSSSSDEQ